MHLETKFNDSIVATVSILFMSAFVMAGCDCFQRIDGVIIDRQTKVPLDGVSIATVDISKNTVTGQVEYSTKNGHFRFSRVSGGIRRCPDLTLYFFKWGYQQTSLTFESGSVNDTIYLDKK